MKCPACLENMKEPDEELGITLARLDEQERQQTMEELEMWLVGNVWECRWGHVIEAAPDDLEA